MIDGSTCLHVSSRFGQLEVVQLLIKSGANVNVANGAGAVPLHLGTPISLLLIISAAAYGQTIIVKALIQYGALVGIQNNEKRTPIEYAKSPEIKTMLTNAGTYL